MRGRLPPGIGKRGFAMKPTIVMTFAALSVIAGCATTASSPTAPSTAWGFHASLTNVPSAESISWAPSLTACEVFRANDISTDERQVREGKVSLPMIFDGTCHAVNVVAGGTWWGFTVPGMAGYGRASSNKDICELLRNTSRLPSACSPVTVK
jgi:hypothetical protein